MKAQQLWFAEPYRVEIREQTLEPVPSGHVLVQTLYSAISPGTEMLVYRGQLPGSLSLDASIASLQQQGPGYPLQYGYASVGKVIEIGSQADPALQGRLVFSFQPHASHYLVRPAELILVPDSVDPLAAVFLVNMETAVNLVQDGSPGIGERVVVLGQGVVGLMTSSLLARFPLSALFAVEGLSTRNKMAGKLANQCFNPDSAPQMQALRSKLETPSEIGGADLVFELSGRPEAINLAIELCGYGSRIVVGSWYGSKRAEVNLGESFHRNRISLVSSQVSTVAPGLSGRWNKARRFNLAWDAIKRCQPEQFITHKLPLADCEEAYALLDNDPQQAVQVVFEYEN